MMEAVFTFLTIFFVIAAAQGIFLFFVIRRLQGNSSIRLASYYLLFSLILLYWVVFWVYNINLYTFALPLELALGPIVYLAVSQKKNQAYHMVPAVTACFVLFPFWIHFIFDVPYLLKFYPAGINVFHIIFHYLKFASLLTYSVLLCAYVKKLYKYEIWIIAGYFVYVAGAYAYILLVHFKWLTSLIDYVIGVVIVCVVYYSGYSVLLFNNSRIKKYPKNYLGELWQNIELLTKEKKLYLSDRYSAEQLSVLLNVPVIDVHQAFSAIGKTTIKKYGNYLKIEHSKEILSKSDLKISMVALEAGFNNKVSFIQNFKKLTNLTPTEYRKSVQSDAQ